MRLLLVNSSLSPSAPHLWPEKKSPEVYYDQPRQGDGVRPHHLRENAWSSNTKLQLSQLKILSLYIRSALGC